jgi:hypothetical protein
MGYLADMVRRPDQWGRYPGDPQYNQAPQAAPPVVPTNAPPPMAPPQQGRPLNQMAPQRPDTRGRITRFAQDGVDSPAGTPPPPPAAVNTRPPLVGDQRPPQEATGPVKPQMPLAPFQYGQGQSLRTDVYGDYAGFDTQREHNISKSAKDAFLFASNQSAAADSFVQASATKEGSEAWFNQHIRPTLEAQGYTIDWVKGDQAFIRSWDGVGIVDFVVNAGHPDPSQRKLAWQPTAQGAQPTGGYTPRTPVEPEQRTESPTNETMPEPTYNEDGTVTLRVSPEAYRRLNLGTPTERNPYRKQLSDMVRPREVA